MTRTTKLPLSTIRVYAGGPHMHYVGRDMIAQLEHARPEQGEQERECLIRIPQWDFNWRRACRYDASDDQLPVVKDGDVLRLRCVSRSNPFLTRAMNEHGLTAPSDVSPCEDTLDELCRASIGIVYANYLP